MEQKEFSSEQLEDWKPGDPPPRIIGVHAHGEFYWDFIIANVENVFEYLDANSPDFDDGLDKIAERLEKTYNFCSDVSLERMAELGSLSQVLEERSSLMSQPNPINDKQLDAIQIRGVLKSIRELSWEAIQTAERGGSIHAIHEAELKALGQIWQTAARVVGLVDEEQL